MNIVYFTCLNTMLFFPISSVRVTLKTHNNIINLPFSSVYTLANSLNTVKVNILTYKTFYKITHSQKTLSY